MKPWFVIIAVTVSAVLVLLSLVQAAVDSRERLAWIAAAVASLPLLLGLARLHWAPAPRTSEHLPLLILVSAAAALVAVWESFIEGTAGWLPSAAAAAGTLWLLLYVFWYSRYGRFPSARFAVGNKLPEFEVRDLEGNLLRSSEMTRAPAVILFYRGNWSGVCVAQLRELAGRAEHLAQMGVGIYVISPQPEAKARALKDELSAPIRFLVDEGNRAADDLDIADYGGVPLRARRTYGADTVMPTTIATNASGTILYSDETDNVRVRPEPDVYISILRRTGAVEA